MKLDIPTLAFVLGLTIFTQVIAIFIQYRLNKTHHGIGWWLLGSIFMAMGFLFLTFGAVKYLWILSRIANPLLVFGRICFFIGTLRFIDKKENLMSICFVFISFAVFYYYYMYGHDDISKRTVIVSSAIALFSLLTAHNLIFNHKKTITESAIFTGTVFLVHGCYLIIIIFYTLLSKPIHSYLDYSPIQIAGFIVPTITSTLWTFGFILMVNQRLNAENGEEQENLRKIFNTSPDAALITRLADGQIVAANLGFLAISGYSRSEIIGNSIRELKIWDDPADQARFTTEIKHSHHCENVESVFQRKDGKSVVGMTSAKILTINDQPHVVSVTRDITEQKHAEEALKESEAIYRSILKASPDDITITDLEGRILMVSPAANRMFGYEQGEEVGRQLLDFVVPEDLERARANITLMYHGGHQRPNEYRGIRKDRTVVDIEVNSGLISGVHGQPIKMVFVVRDNTERKQAELEKQALESKNRQLQKAESLGRMAGAIAHHFNNQLQSVLANLELLSGLPKGVDPSKWLTGAKQATERAAEVSRLMLAYLGQASREQEPSFLAELCRGSMSTIQGTLPKRAVVETDFPSPGPVIRANANQIQQVLTNLIANAWEAMGDTRGSIRLSLRTGRAADIPTVHRFPINWQPQGTEYACLEVVDTGGGIAEADIEKLFDPFFSTKFTGRGLGLSVVLGIVQAHGGAVTVASEQGLGSVFRIHFPLCTEAVPTLPERITPTPEPVASGTVLLVDDDEFLLMSTGGVIEMMGFSLLTAKDGVEALEVFRQHKDRICCVITDLTMPRMDGWETLAALRQLEPTLPVILASGYDKAQVMSGAHPVRPSVFLGKPFGLQGLRDALNQALASGRVEP